MMAFLQDQVRFGGLFQQLDLVVAVDAEMVGAGRLDVIGMIHPALGAFAIRDGVGQWLVGDPVRMGVAVAAAADVAFAAGIALEQAPALADLAKEDRHRGHEDAEEEVEGDPGFEVNVVPW